MHQHPDLRRAFTPQAPTPGTRMAVESWRVGPRHELAGCAGTRDYSYCSVSRTQLDRSDGSRRPTSWPGRVRRDCHEFRHEPGVLPLNLAHPSHFLLLRDRDSNPKFVLQRHACCQLHHPGQRTQDR
jgi:hypothetical protein